MQSDLPDGSFELVDAFPGLRFSNPVIWNTQRLIRGDSSRMLPIGNHMADQQSIAKLGEWIMGLASWRSFDDCNETFFQGTHSALEHQMIYDGQDGWTKWQEF